VRAGGMSWLLLMTRRPRRGREYLLKLEHSDNYS
jgi:hypothetical protein